MNTLAMVWLTIPATLFSMSCGDAVPPPAEGTATVSVQNAGDAPIGKACGAPHGLTWGKDAPTATSQGTTWVDGQDNHTVSCSVSGSGSYSISGTIGQDSSSFHVASNDLQAGGTGTATITLYDTKLALAMYSDVNVPCTVSVNSGDLKVQKGAVWATVSCPKVISRDDMNLWCTVNGTFLFKSCGS